MKTDMTANGQVRCLRNLKGLCAVGMAVLLAAASTRAASETRTVSVGNATTGGTATYTFSDAVSQAGLVKSYQTLITARRVARIDGLALTPVIGQSAVQIHPSVWRAKGDFKSGTTTFASWDRSSTLPDQVGIAPIIRRQIVREQSLPGGIGGFLKLRVTAITRMQADASAALQPAAIGTPPVLAGTSLLLDTAANRSVVFGPLGTVIQNLGDSTVINCNERGAYLFATSVIPVASFDVSATTRGPNGVATTTPIAKGSRFLP